MYATCAHSTLPCTKILHVQSQGIMLYCQLDETPVIRFLIKKPNLDLSMK